MAILEFLWYVIIVFAFMAMIMILFFIFTDLFRDKTLNGWWKAVWIIFLIFFTPITCLVYLIFRGKGMAHRSEEARKQMQEAQQAYIRETAGNAGPAEQITQAKALLDSGAINQQEFDALKAKALGSQPAGGNPAAG